MPERPVVSDAIVAYPYGAISVRSRVTHHLTADLDLSGPLRGTSTVSGSLSATPDGGDMPYREDRTCYVNASRRVTLRDLANDGVLVTSLASGEYVRYTVYAEDGGVYQATQQLGYQLYWSEKGRTYSGWTAVFPAPGTPQTLKLVYEAYVDGKREFWVDSVEVVAF